MKVLLVEDDSIIGQNICEYLEENSFMVTLKDNGEDGLKEAIKNKYDIFIFDVMLPKKDGFQMAKEIREAEVKTPIIFLTAKEDLESKERGFNVGGDDYLTKPFKLKELILRMRSILKRINQTEVLDKITAGDITLDLSLKEVKRGEKIINLTPKEFMILEYLMKNKEKAIPKKEILEYIWGINNDIWSDVIRAHMLTLRKKLNEGFDDDPIKTVRGIGFKFVN
ncbi:DNA-binding response regulator [Candidatus Gracilibacteria bacterium]|nr:response regulator transcription factor [Candidatus Gracilibacteria bacterium]RKW23986.1 MAG: DNA-binding response regulator [Candidatus Gracilibacteria bacterium]